MATTSADLHGYDGDGDTDLGTRDDDILTAMFGASPLPDVADPALGLEAGWYTEVALEDAAIAALSGNGTAGLDARLDFDLGTSDGVVSANSYWQFDGGQFTLNYSSYTNGVITDISVKTVTDPDGNSATGMNYTIAGTTATTDPDDLGVVSPSPYHPTTATGDIETQSFPALPDSIPRTPHSSQWGSVSNSAGSWAAHFDDQLNPLDPQDSSGVIDSKDFTTIAMGTST